QKAAFPGAYQKFSRREAARMLTAVRMLTPRGGSHKRRPAARSFLAFVRLTGHTSERILYALAVCSCRGSTFCPSVDASEPGILHGCDSLPGVGYRSHIRYVEPDLCALGGSISLSGFEPAVESQLRQPAGAQWNHGVLAGGLPGTRAEHHHPGRDRRT